MAVSEKTQKYILNQYAAHWFHLTPAHGLNGWVEWFMMDSTDEWCVNEAFRRIVQERMENERFSSRDILKLTEMQAVYFRVKREIENRDKAEKMQENCGFCDNYGFRWLVYHSDGYMNDEHLIREVPDMPKMFCNKYVIPCTCQRGMELYYGRINRLKKDGRLKREITPGRLHDVLVKWSFNHQEAWQLVLDYTRRRNAVFFPKSKSRQEDEEERHRAFDLFIKRLKTDKGFLSDNKRRETTNDTTDAVKADCPF